MRVGRGSFFVHLFAYLSFKHIIDHLKRDWHGACLYDII